MGVHFGENGDEIVLKKYEAITVDGDTNVVFVPVENCEARREILGPLMKLTVSVTPALYPQGYSPEHTIFLTKERAKKYGIKETIGPTIPDIDPDDTFDERFISLLESLGVAFD